MCSRRPPNLGGHNKTNTTPIVTNQKRAVLQAALYYSSLGWSVIPEQGKRSIIGWEPFQRRRATEREIRHWWAKWPSAGVAVVTGGLSGLVVVDVDGDQGKASIERVHLPPTPAVRTFQGFHYYYRHPGGNVSNSVGLLPGVDIRGDGGYVVAPPSKHPSGYHYSWINGLRPNEVGAARLPDWVQGQGETSAAYKAARAPTKWQELLTGDVPEGSRNDTLARLAGYLLRRYVNIDVALCFLRAWNNQCCKPPLDDTEICRTVSSIARRELDRRRREAARHGR